MNDEEPAAESRPLVEGRRAVHHSRKVALVRVDRIVGFLRPGRNQSTSRPGRTCGDVVIVGGQPTLRCFAIARSYSHSVEIALEHHRSEEHTSELQSLMRISYAVFCLKTKTNTIHPQQILHNE